MLASWTFKIFSISRKNFMREHKAVFQVLSAMQNTYYKSDDRESDLLPYAKTSTYKE